MRVTISIQVHGGWEGAHLWERALAEAVLKLNASSGNHDLPPAHLRETSAVEEDRPPLSS